MVGSAQRYPTFSTCVVHTLDDGLALIVLVRRNPGGGIDCVDCVASALVFYQLIDFAPRPHPQCSVARWRQRSSTPSIDINIIGSGEDE